MLSVTVADVLDGAGKARITYVLGHSTKKLMQVNILWGTAVDPQITAERIVAAANQLRTLFLSSGYEADTIVGNIATGANSITVFQGQDADKHMTLLRLLSSAAQPAKEQAAKEQAAKEQAKGTKAESKGG